MTIACPECGSTNSEVYTTRHRFEMITRRRRCKNKHLFSTIEVAVTDSPRTLKGMRLTTPSLDRKKVIAAVTRTLEENLK